MKKKAIIAIASLLTFGQGAWAQGQEQQQPTISFPRHGEVGNNSESNPYIISSVEDLNALASDVNSGNAYTGKYFKLDAENGLNYSGQTFTPIGWGDNTDGKAFSGIFDGNGNTISGITVNTPDAWGVGLFGYISKATIKNVTITNSSFTAEGFVGAIAGCSDKVDTDLTPTIENCHVTSSVTVNATNLGVGGIIGIDNDNLIIKDCTCAATVTSDDTESEPGGIIGVAYDDDSYMATITDSYYLGDMRAIGVNGGQRGHATINITLLNDNSEAPVNATRIANYHGQTANVTLSGRKLYKDGNWNTLCLPFEVSTTAGPLNGDGVSAMTLNTSTSNLTGSTLTLNFAGATSITAGTPFIIKWDNTGAELNNLEFTGVTINKETNNASVCEHVIFTGAYSPVVIDESGDNTMLYLGAGNSLYYPNGTMTLGAFRAHFQLLDGITAGTPNDQTTNSPNDQVRTFVLNFGEESTGMTEAEANSSRFTLHSSRSVWFDLNGRKLNGKPTAKGLYIHNGRKAVIK